MKINYTKHALRVLSERDIKKSKVTKLLMTPQQILEGKADSKIAQGIFKRTGKNFLLRVVYKQQNDTIKVITAYWTSNIDKYWED